MEFKPVDSNDAVKRVISTESAFLKGWLTYLNRNPLAGGTLFITTRPIASNQTVLESFPSS